MVLEDPTVREFKYLPSYFKEEFFKDRESVNDNFQLLKYYRPLVKIVNLLEYKVFGTNPTGYNALNILLNALVVVLCFMVVLEITNKPEIALLSSILYAVNPSRVEVVSWAYSSAHLMTALFSLSSFYFYLKRRYVVSVFMFSLSLLSHESAVSFPMILLAYEYFVCGNKTFRGHSKILPFLILTGVYLIIRTAAVGPPPLSHLGLFTFVNTAAVVIKRYIKIFFLPDAVVTVYPKELLVNINSEVVISYFVLFLVLSFGVLLWQKKKEYLFWYLWFFIWITVYLNIGTLGDYLMAEKALFLSSIGPCVLIASLVEQFRSKRIPAYLLVSVLAITYSGMTFSRNFYWRETIPYIRKMLDFSPGFTLGHYALGLEYSKKGLHDLAIEEFMKSVLLKPEMATLHLALGKEYANKGDYKKALFIFRETLQLHPQNSEAYNHMGNVLYLLGEPDNAAYAWGKAIEFDPQNAEAYYNIGMIMEKRNDPNSALIYYKKYLSLSSNPAPAAFSRIQQIESKQNKQDK